MNFVGLECARGAAAIISVIKSSGTENDNCSKFVSTANLVINF